MTFNADHHPHRRRNLLTGAWVLVSPHRATRPWQGQEEKPERVRRPAFDPGCYLCPGNLRANGEKNPVYGDVFVFANDFAALAANTPSPENDGGIFETAGATGACRVICFSPDHSKSLAQLEPAAIRRIIDCWAQESSALEAEYAYVQVFENKGAMMGCSNPHPHGQIWATAYIPTEIEIEDRRQRAFYEERGGALLAAVADAEIRDGARVVAVNDDWLAVVPFWAAWPFEILLTTRGDAARLSALVARERNSLADILREVTARYDNLFECSFPYSMGWHQAPSGADARHWRLHAHFYPPLLRSATVRKFMVGFEMLAEAQRDLTPEQAAARLRSLPSRHYLDDAKS